MKKKTLAALLCGMVALFAFAGCGSAPATGTGDGTGQPSSVTEEESGSDSATQADEQTDEGTDESLLGGELKEFSEDELLSGLHHVSMEIQGQGTLQLELDADQAPITVTNFCQLAESGFYDGLTFHRVLPGLIMQGGDPLGSGIGGPGYTIKGEFAANGVDNTLQHTKGAISMARTMDPDGGGCQFFIMDDAYPAWDGQYAAFGYVTEGLEIVDAICANTPTADENGTVEPQNQPVITKVTVLD